LVWETVFRILDNHDEALDCFQDVFAEAFERSSPEEVRNWPAFLRWLATRRALNVLRRRRAAAARVKNTQPVETVASDSLGPVAQAEWNELVERIRREAARLPGHQGEVFWLCSVEQLSYAEVAEQLGVDVNAVGVLLHRARQKLRQTLAGLNPVQH
jgi:RNA polymerase sigma-70 factor (ECF subfamily)